MVLPSLTEETEDQRTAEEQLPGNTIPSPPPASTTRPIIEEELLKNDRVPVDMVTRMTGYLLTW